MKFIYEKITKENLELGLKIQNDIFPTESAKEQYNLSINGTDDFLIMEYYIVYSKDDLDNCDAIGVTGLYVYKNFPDDVWVGYYGVISKYRNKGYGTQILIDTEEMARSKMYKHLRLYTNKILFNDAYRLYKRLGFTEEKYTNFPHKLGDVIMENEVVFSKNLVGREVELWDNRLIIDFELFH